MLERHYADWYPSRVYPDNDIDLAQQYPAIVRHFICRQGTNDQYFGIYIGQEVIFKVWNHGNFAAENEVKRLSESILEIEEGQAKKRTAISHLPQPIVEAIVEYL